MSILNLYSKWKRNNPEKPPIQWITDLQKENINNATIHSRILVLKSLYNVANNQQKIKENPFKEYKKLSFSSKSKMFFDENQVKEIKEYLLSTNQKGLWLACQMCYYCFIRPGELRQLKIEHINFAMGKIEIPGEISKNKKSQMVVIPNNFLPDIIHLSKEKSGKYIFSDNFTPDYTKNSTNFINNHFRKTLKKLNIVGNFSFYSWKHTGAVNSIRAGINIKELQVQLRHHSLDMVNEYLKNLGVFDLPNIENKFPEI